MPKPGTQCQQIIYSCTKFILTYHIVCIMLLYVYKQLHTIHNAIRFNVHPHYMYIVIVECQFICEI